MDNDNDGLYLFKQIILHTELEVEGVELVITVEVQGSGFHMSDEGTDEENGGWSWSIAETHHNNARLLRDFLDYVVSSAPKDMDFNGAWDFKELALYVENENIGTELVRFIISYDYTMTMIYGREEESKIYIESIPFKAVVKLSQFLNYSIKGEV